MSSALAVDKVVALSALFESEGGSYLSHGVRPGRGWASRFPSVEIPEFIHREDVFAATARATASDEWTEVLVLAMAWGYGPGYGAHRSASIKRKLNDVNCWMNGLWEASLTDPKAGFSYLSEPENRVLGLGPAFATKLLYFVSPEDNRAPIIDAVVSAWMWRNGVATSGEPMTSHRFDVEAYGRYIAFADKCLAAITRNQPRLPEVVDRGFIEYLIFQDELFHRGKTRRLEPWIRPSKDLE